MKFETRERNVPSTDGKHTLRGVIYIPETDCFKGKIELIHGMTEHIARYAKFMSELAESGYIVYAYDQIGHGKTADNDGELGFIADKNGYDALINDVKAFAEDVEREFPGYKRILFGHSMGSFTTRLAVTRYPDIADMYICSGTGGPNPVAGVGLTLAKVISAFKGKKHISGFIDKLAFGTYNDRTDKRTPYDWLTYDNTIVDAYAKDKFCTFKFTLSAMCDLIYMNKTCNDKKWFASFRKDMPILLISGEEDPVGNYGKGVTQVSDMLTQTGVKDVTLKLFPHNRHEVLNDSGHAESVNTIIKWIDER